MDQHLSEKKLYQANNKHHGYGYEGKLFGVKYCIKNRLFCVVNFIYGILFVSLAFQSLWFDYGYGAVMTDILKIEAWYAFDSDD